MDNPTLWKLTEEAYQAILPLYEPLFDRYIEEQGIDGRLVSLLLTAITFEPETSTADRMRVRNPYTAPSAYLERLDSAVKVGYMIQAAPGEYRMTHKGRQAVEWLIDEGRVAMQKGDPLPHSESLRLAELLGKLVQASLEEPPPSGNWSISHSYKLMPAIDPPLPYIEQAISCLHGYRDDAHLSAWQPSGLSGPALESLTLLWRGEANTSVTLCGRLAAHGHAPQVCAEALSELRASGFIQGNGDEPKLTRAGKVFREQVERDTDLYFFKPWACLSFEERYELKDLLKQLRDGLK